MKPQLGVVQSCIIAMYMYHLLWRKFIDIYLYASEVQTPLGKWFSA